MPIYEYQCQFCGHLFEELQSMSEAPLVKCPKCGKDGLKKLIGTGGGIIFKGSGFYQTDYKKNSHTSSKSETPPLETKDTKEKKDTKELKASKETKDTKESKPEKKPDTKSKTKK